MCVFNRLILYRFRMAVVIEWSHQQALVYIEGKTIPHLSSFISFFFHPFFYSKTKLQLTCSNIRDVFLRIQDVKMNPFADFPVVLLCKAALKTVDLFKKGKGIERCFKSAVFYYFLVRAKTSLFERK